MGVDTSERNSLLMVVEKAAHEGQSLKRSVAFCTSTPHDSLQRRRSYPSRFRRLRWLVHSSTARSDGCVLVTLPRVAVEPFLSTAAEAPCHADGPHAT